MKTLRYPATQPVRLARYAAAGLATARVPAGRALASSALAALTLAAAAALPAAAWADPLAVVDLGRKTYTSYCARCHGFNLVMVSGTFDLRRFPQDEKERFTRSVSKGVRAMPAWEGTVKPEEIEAIWAYVASVNGWGGAEETPGRPKFP